MGGLKTSRVRHFLLFRFGEPAGQPRLLTAFYTAASEIRHYIHPPEACWAEGFLAAVCTASWLDTMQAGSSKVVAASAGSTVSVPLIGTSEPFKGTLCSLFRTLERPTPPLLFSLPFWSRLAALTHQAMVRRCSDC